MMRRQFITTSVAAGLAATAGGGAMASAGASSQVGSAGGGGSSSGFKLRYAPHFGMFRHSAGDDLIDQLKFMADHGFTALEDNNMTGRSVEEQERIAKEMQRLDMEMGVFVANFGTAFGKRSFTNGDADLRENFLADCRKSVEVAKRVHARWMTVVMGDLEPRLDIDYQTAHAVEQLKRGAEIFEPHGLVMVLEPLNPRDHPGMFLTKMSQAFQVCRAVNSPACKILDDLYHQQITEGNLIPNIDMAWDEIAYFQLGDNPGRREPTTGEINFLNVFKHIYGKGYNGIVGMEHGLSKGGKEGEEALIKAYRECDSF